MKTTIHYLGIFAIVMSLTSCVIEQDGYYNGVSLEQVMTDYDLWYVDYNQTTGTGNVPFVSKAFTLSFIRGNVFANNNIVGIGYTGNGYGVKKGTYDTGTGSLRVYHDTDGMYEFQVTAVTPNKIKLYNSRYNVTYYLTGYQKNYFDFDQVFYDNIEYFLQEYFAWEKYYTSVAGTPNVFDDENYLGFTPENNTTFYSSVDPTGLPLNNIHWDYTGTYEVYDVVGYDNLKILSLYYSPTGYEEFELTVLNDAKIELYHISSGTTYRFEGLGFIQYRMSGNSKIKKDFSERERTKISRKQVERNPKALLERK